VAGVFIRRGERENAVLIRAKDAAWAQICAESDGAVSAVRRDRERFPVPVGPTRQGVLPHIAATSLAARRRRSAGTSQVSLCYQPADIKIKKFLIDRRDSYAASPQCLLRPWPCVGRENMLKVHPRRRAPGSRHQVDKERDERGHRMAGVLGGMSQQ